jgi:hypothetical protein
MEDISCAVMEDTSCEVADVMAEHGEVVEHVSGYEMRIVPAKYSPAPCRGAEERGEALAAWLLSRWREQQQGAMN